MNGKKIFTIGLAVLMAFNGLFSNPAYSRLRNGRSSMPFRNAVPGEIVVKFKSGTSSVGMARAMSRNGHAKASDLGVARMAHIRLAPGERIEDAMSDYGSDPSVEYVQPNYIYHAAAVPSDPLYAQQWGFKNSGQTVVQGNSFDPIDALHNPGMAGKDMGLEQAWDLITDCSSVIVAVVDTGINYNHLDLAANMWNGGATYPNHGFDFVSNDNDPMDLNGHGTHVSGTIGAVGNNGVGSTGICWKAQLMAVRVLDATGNGTTITVVQGINFAANNGAKVINMSLATSGFDQTMSDAVTAAAAKGVVIVAAAGNEAVNNDGGAAQSYPCDLTQPNIICVAAVDQFYQLAAFSNYGVTSVDVGAPGTNILSTWAGNENPINDTFNTGGTLNWTASTTTTGGWAYGPRTFMTLGGPITIDVLFDPNNWDGKNNTYHANTDDQVYKTFDLSGSNVVSLDFGAFLDTLSNQDFVKLYYSKTGGSPFAAGTLLDSFSGSTNNQSVNINYDLTPCNTATCSVGFRLTSGATAGKTGVAIFDLKLTKFTVDNTHYNVIEGTSMATPHVTGLVAMIMAFNPQYTMADVVNSVENGGVSDTALAGKTTTGKTVSAIGSLSYINPPSGLVLAK